MRTSVPRLHSVRMKIGGAEVRVIDVRRLSHDVERRLERAARGHHHDSGLAGFALVTWGANGGTSTTVRVSHGAVVRQTVQHLIEECVRDYLIGGSAEDAVMERLGFRPPDGA